MSSVQNFQLKYSQSSCPNKGKKYVSSETSALACGKNCQECVDFSCPAFTSLGGKCVNSLFEENGTAKKCTYYRSPCDLKETGDTNNLSVVYESIICADKNLVKSNKWT